MEAKFKRDVIPLSWFLYFVGQCCSDVSEHITLVICKLKAAERRMLQDVYIRLATGVWVEVWIVLISYR